MEEAHKPIYPLIDSTTNDKNQLSEVFVASEFGGLSKREYFAGLAMQGLLVNAGRNGLDLKQPNKLAEMAIKHAEALLYELCPF